MIKKQNYYERVVRRKQDMKHDPILLKWAKTKKLNKQSLDRAIDAILAGKSSFEPTVKARRKKGSWIYKANWVIKANGEAIFRQRY